MEGRDNNGSQYAESRGDRKKEKKITEKESQRQRQIYTHLDFGKEVSDKYVNLGAMSIELLI